MCPADLLWSGVPAEDPLARQETVRYLRSHGLGENYLKRARKAVEDQHEVEFRFDADKRYCDFCFRELTGVEYDVLADGRERCAICSRSVVRTEADFLEIVQEVRRTMQQAFPIGLRLPQELQMVDARKIAREVNRRFVATSEADPRVLGFVRKTAETYALFIENGAPKLAATATIAHELTHVWQFFNWDGRTIPERFGSADRRVLHEGMASWAEIQYLYFINETEYARRQEEYTRSRDDEYGTGFRAFAERYPIDRKGGAPRETPFRAATFLEEIELQPAEEPEPQERSWWWRVLRRLSRALQRSRA